MHSRNDPNAPFGIIYALFSSGDPNAYRYVGLTRLMLKDRLTIHRSKMKCGGRSHVYKWMRAETKKGCRIEAQVLHVVAPDEDIRDLEIEWIAKISESNNLCNHTKGGDGLTGYKFSADENAKNSERQKRRFSDPIARKKIAEGVIRFREENPERAVEIDKTLAELHVNNPDFYLEHSDRMKKWWQENPDKVIERSQKRKSWYHARLQSGGEGLGYGGVTWSNQKKLWQARINNNLLGYFENQTDAIVMRKRAEQFILSGGDVKAFKVLIKLTDEEVAASYKRRGEKRRRRIS